MQKCQGLKKYQGIYALFHAYICHTDEYMVPFHTDNGLYLLITPYSSHALKIKTSSGTIVDTDYIESDSILGMFNSCKLSEMFSDSELLGLD